MSIAEMTARELVWQCAGGYDHPKCSDDWYAKAGASEAALLRVRAMNDDECDEAARLEFVQCLQMHSDMIKGKRERKAALAVLASDIMELDLPGEFKAVQSAAIAKIVVENRERCNLDWEQRNYPEQQSGETWRKDEIARLEKDVEYERNAGAIDEARAARRDERLARLFKHLSAAE